MDFGSRSCNTETSDKNAGESVSCPYTSTGISHLQDFRDPDGVAIASSSSLPRQNSDSDDELPSYGIKWTPKIKKGNSSNEDWRVRLNIDEIIAKRKEDEEFFAQMGQLDTLLEGELQPSICSNKKSFSKTVDEDVIFIIEKAKEMEVAESTIRNIHYRAVMDPKKSLTIFNHATLNIDHFVQDDTLRELLKQGLPSLNIIMNMQGCVLINLNREDGEGLCSYLLYLMSVHPQSDVVTNCYDLLNSLTFYSCLTDFINVLRNWGCDLHRLYVSVPNIYIGLHESFIVSPKGNVEVKDINLQYVLLYLQKLVQQHSPDSFYDFIEPLMRLLFDDKIKPVSNIWKIVISIIKLLLLSKNCLSKVPGSKVLLVKAIHRQDLPLYCQTMLCTVVLRQTCFASPLGYATLQQFLGCSDIIYCQNVNLDTVYILLVEKKNIIEMSTYLDVFCYLTLIQMFLIDKRVDSSETNYEHWHDLFHDLYSHVARNDRCPDPIIVKERIAKLQYIMRIKQGKRIRQHDNSILKKRSLYLKV